MKKLTHPADGLYYLNPKMLRDGHACSEHRNRWFRDNGRGKVPITLERMYKQELLQFSSAFAWCLRRMHICYKITDHEYRASFKKWSEGRCNLYSHQRDEYNIYALHDARSLMDMLYRRAKREGRIR